MSIPSWARPGTKVIAIRGPEEDYELDTYDGPKTGTVCTLVRAYVEYDGIDSCTIEEHSGLFYMSDFRLAKTQAEDVALFAPLLERKRSPLFLSVSERPA